MNLEELNVKLSYPLIITGLCAVGIGSIWFLMRCLRRDRPFFRRVAAPLILVAMGAVFVAAPPTIGKFVPIDLRSWERVIDGDRHIGVTGWDRKDYSFLSEKSDVVVLQMANPDVTDTVVAMLADFKKLRELDISNSRITDASLEQIAKLPALQTLFLNNTKVSGSAVMKHLTGHPTLRMLWMRGTSVTKEDADAIKAAKPGRRVTVDSPN